MTDDFKKFEYTAEQAAAYEAHSDILDADGIMMHGKFAGEPVDQVPVDYLQALIQSTLGDAIVLQDVVSRRTVDGLIQLCRYMPDAKEFFISHYDRMKGVTLTPEQLASLSAPNEQE